MAGTKSQRYPLELKRRAVAMVLETIRNNGGVRYGAIAGVAKKLGMSPETLRNWVRQVEVDDGARPGTTTSDRERIAELERELREVRRANEILQSAATFFGAELDRRRR